MAVTNSKTKLWAASKIPYEIVDPHPAHPQIIDAMHQIEKNTSIWFCRRGNEPNYISIINNPNRNNHSEQVGMIQGGYNVNIKGDGWWALHELCHAVGLIHEQIRSDSQTHIQTFYRTNQTVTVCGNVVIPANPNGVVDMGQSDMAVHCNTHNLTAYDPESVMHYAKSMGLIAGANPPSMVLRADPSKPLGAENRRVLSNLDVVGIRELYKSNISGWQPGKKVRDVSSQHQPALTVFSGNLIAAWNGFRGEGIHFSSFEAEEDHWTPPFTIPGTKHSPTGPGMAVHGKELYVVMALNQRTLNELHYVSTSGDRWSEPKPLSSGAFTTHNPAIATYDGKLFAVWNGEDNEAVYYSIFDGSSWSGKQVVPGIHTSAGPTLTVLNNKLYLSYTNLVGGGLYYLTYDSSWSAPVRASVFGARSSPALALNFDPYNTTKRSIYLAWRGVGDGNIWWANQDPASGEWSGQARTHIRTPEGIAMAEHKGNLYLMWVATNEWGAHDGLWYSKFVV